MITKEDLSNSKIFVGCPEMSELVQKALFEFGYHWGSGITKLRDNAFVSIQIDGSANLYYDFSVESFIKSEKKEILATDVLKLAEQERQKSPDKIKVLSNGNPVFICKDCARALGLA